MIRFLQFLREAFSQNIVHKNPPIEAMKNMAKHYGALRYVLHNDGSYVAGDAWNFTHQQMSPDVGSWHSYGMINSDHTFTAYHPYSQTQAERHPFHDRLEKNGVGRAR